MNFGVEDTIAAVATPLGEGGVGIVRVSGRDAVAVVARVFDGKRSLEEVGTHRLVHGTIVDRGETIDEVLVGVMKGPRSYTGEDVVEVGCHGGAFVVRRVLETVLRAGARVAERGEFTRRAFLSGKMDLMQAEAVLDMVRAKGERGRRAAFGQLGGRLSERISGVRDRLRECLVLLEISLDFSEEDWEGVERDRLGEVLEGEVAEIGTLCASFREGRLVREGVRAVLVGKPNVGKSSVLNALLGEERAIVTPMPGTTRDTVEEWLDVDGMGFRVIDTAGLRDGGDEVEMEGVRRTRLRMEDGDLLMVVVDGSSGLEEEDAGVERATAGRTRIVVVNKCDLGRGVEDGELRGMFGRTERVEMSAKEGWGLGELREAMRRAAETGEMGENGTTVTRLRHAECLRRAEEAGRSALRALTEGLSFEYPAFDVREALDALGEMAGETTSEEILDRIFGEFCIGK